MILGGRYASCMCFLFLAFLLGNAGTAFAEDVPSWFVDGRPTAEASQAVQILESAGEDGLNPGDYQAHALARAVGDAGRSVPLSDARQSVLAVALTQAMERFISDLHFGRVNPHDIYVSLNVPPKQLDPASYLREAVSSHTLTTAVRAAAPQLPLYAALRQALAEYRELDKNPALQRRLPPLPAHKIQPGQHYSSLGDLARKLIGFGRSACRYGGRNAVRRCADRWRQGISDSAWTGCGWNYWQEYLRTAEYSRRSAHTADRIDA